ncbi:MAG TPA: hypothetical protein PLL15_06135 [Syntrophales bacterium]|nr:hypothetical protein [Syntrophales bacterium]
MILTCRTFLTARLKELLLPDGTTHPFSYGPARNIYFEELPLDFLKDNDYAAVCLDLRDTHKKSGQVIAKSRNEALTELTVTRRRYDRVILYRCLLYALRPDDLWGAGEYIGLTEQLGKRIADFRWIADSDNSAIRVTVQDQARPWNADEEMDRKLRRPKLAIVRVEFAGGIQKTETQPLIPSVEITPNVVS